MRVLGIDYGEKRIGIALSDESGRIAYPLETVEGGEGALEEIERIAVQEAVGRMIIGLPRNMDGSLGPKAREVLRFVELLRGRFQIPLETWDERLSTVEAERYLKEAGLSRRQIRDRVDRVAAQIFLQSYLDSRNRPGEIL